MCMFYELFIFIESDGQCGVFLYIMYLLLNDRVYLSCLEES